MKGKEQTVKNMTVGSPFKLIMAFSLPLMAGTIFQQLYTIVDTMVVGQALGVSALAALGTIDTINWVTLGAVQGFTQGFGILIAQKFGEKDHENLKRVIVNALILSGYIAIALLIILQLGIVPALHLLQVPEEIMPMSIQYLRILMAGLPIVVGYNILAVILRSLGDSKTPLQAMIISTIANIILDILFVVVFHMGIPGAAIATLIAQFMSTAYCGWVFSKINLFRITRNDLKVDGTWSGEMWRLGTPMAVQNVIISMGGMVLQSIIDSYGVVLIAGSTATNKLYGILDCAALAYGYAMTTYVGQNYGAKRIDRIKRGVVTASVIAFVSCVIIATVMILAGKLFLSLFIAGTPQEVEQTMDYAYGFLRDMSLFLPTLYLIYIFRSILQGLGHTVITMWSGFIELIIRIVAALTVPAIFGPKYMFYAHILAWIGSDVILLIGYFYYMNRLEKQLVDVHDELK